MKNIKEKPKYNAVQNSLFMVRTAWRSEKKVLLLLVLEVILTLGIQLAELYLSPTVIGAVERRVPLSELLLLIGGFTLLLVVLHGGNTYIIENRLYPRVTVRGSILNMINRKCCDTSYINRFEKKFMQLSGRCFDATKSNDAASEAIWGELAEFFCHLLGIGFYAVLLTSVNPVIFAVILLTTVIGYSVSRYTNSYDYRHREELGDIERKLWYIQDTENDHVMAKDIRLFGLGNWLEELYERCLGAFRAFQMRAQKFYMIAEISYLLLTFLRNGFAYAFLIGMVLRNDLSAAEFLLYFNAVGVAAAQIAGISANLTTLHRQSLEITSIREFLEYPEPFRFENGNPIPAADSYTVRLENVSFRYPGEEKDTLKHLDLTLSPGEKLAVVGLNGAGKTTLVKLICGLFDPTEGRVTLNGTDIRTFDRREYYRLFSAVFQQFSVLPASVSENVSGDIGAADSEKVMDSVERSGLKEKIEALPDGYDSKLNKEVYEEAAEFSGGELQRLMLARALYKDAPILLLDEPTAALDPIAESEIYERYNEMTAGKSAVFISHRLASTGFCDRILLISDGTVAEEGTHKELMARGGMYAELFSVQSKYYGEGAIDNEG